MPEAEFHRRPAAASHPHCLRGIFGLTQSSPVGQPARQRKNLEPEPVTFRYKKELDPDSIPQFGLVAEHVEKVNPDLVARDDQGKVYTVRYEAVNAMLLNEFLKEHRKGEQQDRKIEELEAQIAHQRREFQTTISQLQSALKEQAAQIQKVSAQVEMSKPATRIVVNSP